MALAFPFHKAFPFWKCVHFWCPVRLSTKTCACFVHCQTAKSHNKKSERTVCVDTTLITNIWICRKLQRWCWFIQTPALRMQDVKNKMLSLTQRTRVLESGRQRKLEFPTGSPRSRLDWIILSNDQLSQSLNLEDKIYDWACLPFLGMTWKLWDI